ncbi:MAG: permease [Boseongicola sp.]
MTDATHSQVSTRRIDRVWILVFAMPFIIALFDPAQSLETLRFAGKAMVQTGAFIAFAVLAVGYLKASGAESLLARAFEGREVRMIVMAALLGGLSPFCSCEVIPFIAALLAVGAPLSAVMAFWLSSPLMDPAMFAITAGALGFNFAVAKTVAAVSIGLLGGGAVYAFKATPIFADPLKPQSGGTGCGCGPSPFKGAPVWKFWGEPPRREIFRDAVVDNALFLGKWLLLAYMIESLMLTYIPAELIATVLGGDGLQPIALGALIGMPAYLNGYAAVPLVQALVAQGMVQGAAMSFVLAGGVSCIPAAVAVWALVKPRVFAAYLGIALVGSFTAGIVWSIFAM